jgi:hypothetical protein
MPIELDLIFVNIGMLCLHIGRHHGLLMHIEVSNYFELVWAFED